MMVKLRLKPVALEALSEAGALTATLLIQVSYQLLLEQPGLEAVGHQLLLTAHA